MAKFKKVKCIVCGKIFEPPVNNAITCSVECRTIRRKEVVKTWHTEHKKGKTKENKVKNSLEETLNSANKANISYGMYVAIRDGYLQDY